MLLIRRIVRRFCGVPDGTKRPMRISGVESLAIALAGVDYSELARAGRFFHGGSQASTGCIASVTAIPSTTAAIALFNGEPMGGRSYMIHRVGAFGFSGTVASGMTLMGVVSPQKIATPPTTNAAGTGYQSASGGTWGSYALFGTSVTIPNGTNGAAPAWKALTSNFLVGSAAPLGIGDGSFEGKGMLVVPPGYAFGVSVLAGAGTSPLYGVSFAWSEHEADLE